MSLTEELQENDKVTKSFSFSKQSYTKISHGSLSNIHNPLREAPYIKSLSQVNVTFSNSGLDQSNLKSGHRELRQITGWRRAITGDSSAIKHLQDLTGDIANILYQKRNIDELIEKSFFPIVQIDSKGELISFTAYNPYPNVPAVPSFFWNDWLHSTYRLQDAGPRNVLFIHYMVWQPRQANQFLPLLLQTSFTEFLHLDRIIIVKPPFANVPDFYREHFIPVLPFGWEIMNFNSIQSLLVCLRTSIIHSLPIRTAFEEEFDSIVPFVKSHIDSETLDTSSLDFINFLYNEEKITLICEFEGSIAGLMVLNMKIDLDFLNEGFELAAFNGLRKKHAEYDDKYENEMLLLPQQSSTKIHDHPDVLISSELLFSKINWELAVSQSGITEASVRLNRSSDSLFTNSDYSGFSLTDVSVLGLKTSEMDLINFSKFNTPLQIPSKYDLTSKTVDVRTKIRTSLNGVPRFYFPQYNGSPNAFLIDFFAIDTNRLNEKLSSFDFLTAAFENVPDRDYCVLLIPTDLLPFPLLDMFVRVTPRIMTTLKQELYLCHKKSLKVTSMIVRNATQQDLIPISSFLRNLNDWNKIYRDIINSFRSNSEFETFVLTVENEIVGVSVIQSQDASEPFSLYFDVSDYLSIDPQESKTQRVIKHLILNPIYYCHARFFVRDLLRLADLNCLYYTHNECNKVGLCNNRYTGTHNCSPSFSLYLMNLRICGFAKFQVNNVIVVVGASRTSTAFLENLIFGETSPYVFYNNLICVTPHASDLEGPEDVRHLMFPIRGSDTRNYLAMLSLETHVTFVYGVMTAINRTEKNIVVNHKVEVKYDYLILTCGLQYSPPVPIARETPKIPCKKFYKSALARYLFRPNVSRKCPEALKYPLNMYIINSSYDAKNALLFIQRLMQKQKTSTDRKIVVYGHNLEVFLIINTFLKLGIPGELIVLIEPFPTNANSVTVFNDYQVDQAVLESIKNLKIIHYKEYFLYDWTTASEDYISALTFQSKRKQVVIPCMAFFPLVQKLVPDMAFQACSNAGLVYDGKLVINHNFRTNDNNIYAAGPFTKYSKRYYANDQDHRFYNSTEVGEKLANILRGKIDPTIEDATVETSDLVPELKAPLLVYCQLPGELNLLMIRKPGKELDLETAYNFPNYGEVLQTGDCKMKKGIGYFRLHLDPEGFVESITCFTKDTINYLDMYSLYGLHEKLLNNLLLRYDVGLIPDLYAHFHEPWAAALFHENFAFLRDENMKVFQQTLLKNPSKNFIRKITKRLINNKWQSLSDSAKRRIHIEYLNSKIERQIRNNVLQFLEFYNSELTMYAVPSVKNTILYDKSSQSLT
ncbi:hypothetical protein RUM44_010892 [Polyplax serrata]|uniref:Cilia- and flagella-associated protein 61 N-terminal domain-containing protein n=1 Tax=Polyplax serrata TaxID=468196 RepID=A0ABR1AQ11_POLSC